MNLGIFEAKKVYAVLLAFHGQEVVTPEVRVKSLGGESIYEREMMPREEAYGEGMSEPLDYEPTLEPEEPEVEEEPLCIICEENPAALEHQCGAKLCKDCLAEYNERYAKLYEGGEGEMICPKCGEEIVIPRKRKGRKGEDFIRL
jgi:hypothetical protein